MLSFASGLLILLLSTSTLPSPFPSNAPLSWVSLIPSLESGVVLVGEIHGTFSDSNRASDVVKPQTGCLSRAVDSCHRPVQEVAWVRAKMTPTGPYFLGIYGTRHH